MSSRHTPEFRAQIVDDYQAGTSSIQLSRTHGIGPTTILRWIREAGVERRPAYEPAKDKKCSHEGCTRHHHARGYCRLHYAHHIEGDTPRQHTTDRAARLEDCRWMAAHGESLTGAARRIGIGRDGLEAWLLKYDRATLTTLRRRDVWPDESRATFHGAGIRVSA